MGKVKTPKRIWEIDAARGIGIICVVIMHIFCYLSDLSSVQIEWSPFFYFIKQYAGSFFILLSGLATYFGSHSVKRGTVVMGCGFILTALSVWLYLSGREEEWILVQWGVLHLIGFCMLIYPIIKKLPTPALAVLALVILVLGYYLNDNVRVNTYYLFPLGLRSAEFCAWDWFPIMPGLGWFMAGILLGRTAYKRKQTLLPKWNPDLPILRFFRWCGRNSLQIYVVQMILFYPIAKMI